MKILNYTENVLSIINGQDLTTPCSYEFEGNCPVVEGQIEIH